MPDLTEKHLRHFAAAPDTALPDEVRAMAAELIEARARIANSTRRKITTIAEAAALPNGSILLVLSLIPRAYVRDVSGWYVAGPIRGRLSTFGVMAGETAIVLWEPEVSDRG